MVVLELAGEDIPRAQVAQLRAQGAAWVTGAVAATVRDAGVRRLRGRVKWTGDLAKLRTGRTSHR